MAKITTIINPLTGQPAQVDQLEHTAQEIDDAIARAIPGGDIDTLLQNKAPAGYGLGMKSNSSISDADNITAFGFYTAKTNTPTNDWCTILNIPYGQNRATQFSTLGEAASVNKYSYCKREKIDGIWKPWEWVNPRMELGVEYRTTERYQGKPVYVKLVNFGALPNATTKKINYGDSGCSPIFGYGISSGTTFPTLSYGGALADSLNSGRVISLWFNGNELSISCGGDRSKINAYVFVKYYKTTD